MLGNDTGAINSELAARIAALLEQRCLTVRSAGAPTATAAADFFHVRQGKLDRFTVGRPIAMPRLDQLLEISLLVGQRGTRARIAMEEFG